MRARSRVIHRRAELRGLAPAPSAAVLLRPRNRAHLCAPENARLLQLAHNGHKLALAAAIIEQLCTGGQPRTRVRATQGGGAQY